MAATAAACYHPGMDARCTLPTNDDTLLRVRQVACIIGVGEETVRRWLHAGRLTGAKFGGRTGWRVRAGDVRAFVASRCRPNLRASPDDE